jgi:hypothetical protein
MQATFLTLHDVEVVSLKGADSRVFIDELVRLKVLASPEAASGLLAQRPLVVARYVGPGAADTICAALRAIGADVWLPVSQVVCPHCGFSIRCEGEAAPQQDGIVFCCRVCERLTLLSTTECRFRPVFRCDVCHALTDLPPKPSPGQYRCACGNTLDYVVPERAVSLRPRKRPFPFQACLAGLCAIVIVATAAWNWLSTERGPESEVDSHVSARASTVAPLSTEVLAEFEAGAGYREIVAALGAPYRESSSQDGSARILFYRGYDLYVVLERSETDFRYARTVRISDGIVLHERSTP